MKCISHLRFVCFNWIVDFQKVDCRFQKVSSPYLFATVPSMLDLYY
jgi:hypothetical protein